METTDLDPHPLRQIAVWLEAALEAGEPLPEKMALATATADGWPSVRMVILRETSPGLVFFTDNESEKAIELRSNPHAAAVLHWLRPTQRQVRVIGPVELVGTDECDRYWATRPPGGRWSAAASQQSLVVASRDVLEAQMADLERLFPDETRLSRPPRWVGFRLRPDLIEFWQESADRLHDRLRYRHSTEGWTVERLSP